MSDSRRFKIDTRLMHLGRDPKAQFGAVNPPVVHASTILFDTLEDFEAAQRARLEKERIYYGRYGTPTTFALEKAVANLEGGYGALAVPSGLAAIIGPLLALAARDDHILIPDAVYYPVRDVCDSLLAGLGIETTYYDPTIGAGVADHLRPNTKAILLEAPASLTFEMQDVPAITAVARKRGVPTIMDNTWSTPVLFRPLEHGADISIHAGTKYIVGHSDAMLGLVVTTEPYFRTVRHALMRLGYAAAPDDAYLALRGFRTLSVRLARHEANGLRLARWLQSRPEVARVMHPGLPGDPGHALWRRDWRGASGLFGLVLHPVPDRAVSAMLNGLELFGMGASWGGFESLILRVHPEKARSVTRWEAAGPTLRIHAGLEDPDDLIADLEAGFVRLAQSAGGPGDSRNPAQ